MFGPFPEDVPPVENVSTDIPPVEDVAPDPPVEDVAPDPPVEDVAPDAPADSPPTVATPPPAGFCTGENFTR